MLGQKYGYRPFPPEIEAREFEELRLWSNTDERLLLDKWFKKDTNNIPSVYVLQPISSVLTNYTNKVGSKFAPDGVRPSEPCFSSRTHYLANSFLVEKCSGP